MSDHTNVHLIVECYMRGTLSMAEYAAQENLQLEVVERLIKDGLLNMDRDLNNIRSIIEGVRK